MTNIMLFAQPYDISATGFYFETVEQYDAQAAKAVNAYGQRVEEFEIQFIDGERIDFALSRAWELCQVNFAAFLEAAQSWDEEKKHLYIIAVGDCGYGHFDVVDDPDGIEIDLYSVESLRELAENFVDEGLFGEVPDSLASHIDYDSIARDLAADFSETEIAGEKLVYAYR
ncbi:antirestriction protein ArdA [Minwuia sp.]|uniref:antirestriction protein ArdA n=1 Tax=Minwuia sp. TaxID=2493630 RepID=UPI003A91580B